MSDNISLARIYSRKYLKISTNQIQGISDYNYSYSYSRNVLKIKFDSQNFVLCKEKISKINSIHLFIRYCINDQTSLFNI